MSKELKLSILALVALPIFAVWFFWGRPAADVTIQSSSAPHPEIAGDAAPVWSATPTTNLVAPLASEGVVPGTPAPTSSADGAAGERARLFMPHRPSFPKGAPVGCEPPYTIDSEGNKHYKKDCF